MINSAGSRPIKLDALNDSSHNVNDHNLSFEPTFNPIERGGYFWVVFSSERTWGNERTTYGTSGDKRLWVAAIDKRHRHHGPEPPAVLFGRPSADHDQHARVLGALGMHADRHRPTRGRPAHAPPVTSAAPDSATPENASTSRSSLAKISAAHARKPATAATRTSSIAPAESVRTPLADPSLILFGAGFYG